MPSGEFTNQHEKILAEGDYSLLNSAEENEFRQVRNGVGIVPIAVGLGAAYMLYRKYMSTRIKEAVEAHRNEVTPDLMETAAAVAFDTFVPQWVSMVAPYILSGYLEGMKSANSGYVPLKYLEKIAVDYAVDMGNHINDVSSRAMMLGYIGQVNKKVPEYTAGERVADAYGVPERGMNTLVNVWTADTPKLNTFQRMPDVKKQKASIIIETQNELRSRVFGDQERWAARSQAKQIVWMFGMEKGIIPETATRTWITSEDERVCTSCGPLHEASVPVNEKFVTTTGEFWAPPLHVNCRCDVILDFNFGDEVQEEINRLLDEEMSNVRKARGDDPFDRDAKGRFSRTESRTSRTTFAAPQESITLPGIPLTNPFQRSDEVPSSTNQFAQNPFSRSRTSQFSGGPFSRSPYNRPEAKQNELQREYVRDFGERAYSRTFHREFNRDMTRQFVQNIVAQTPPPPPPPKESKWHQLDEPLIAVIKPTVSHFYSADYVDFHGDEVEIKDEHMDFVQIYDSNSGAADAISDYWMQDAQAIIIGRFAERDAPGIWHYDYPEQEYIVDMDTIVSAVHNVINGIPENQMEDVTLYTADGIESAVFNISQIAEELQLELLVDDLAPTIVVMHAGTSQTHQQSDGTWSNPGKYKLERVDAEDLSHLKYNVYQGTPVVDDYDD